MKFSRMISPAAKMLITLALLIGCQTAGAQWVKQRSPTISWLRDIYFLDSGRGWIVGADGTLLSTSDAGRTWLPAPKFTTDTILRVHFTDENTGWLLCERSIFSRGQNAVSYLRKTNDGGRTWERIEFMDGGRERVTTILFDGAGRGTAFGEGGVFYSLQEDGRTWRKSRSAIHYLLLAGSFADQQTGAIVGAGGTILFTSDGGLTWENASLISDPGPRLNAVFFASNRHGWAAGSGGTVFASIGSGHTWRRQFTGVSVDLNDVYFSDPRNGWAVGDNGTMIATTNGGSSWTEQNSGVKHRLERLASNGKSVWAVGYGGTILSYDAENGKQSEGRPVIRTRN